MKDVPITDEQRRDEDRSDLQGIVFGAVAALAVIALLVAAFVIGYHRGQASVEDNPPAAEKAQSGGGGGTGGGGAAQADFKSACGSCHTLKAAATTGTSGPDLDILKLDAQRVLTQIEKGGAAMPAALLTGKKAQEVADYVAQNAGK